MKFATILQLFIIYLFTNYRVNSQLNCLPFQIVFTGVTNITSTPTGWEGGGQAGSHKVASKGYVFTKTRQIASIDVIFTSTYHTKKLNPWPHSSASCVVDYSCLSACQGDMEPFEGNLNTYGHLTRLGNKPQEQDTAKAAWATFSINTCLNCQFMIMCTANI